jgi:hypothetical protein
MPGGRSIRRTVVGVLLTGAAACTPAAERPVTPGAAPPPPDVAREEAAAPDSILWSNLRLLTWNDFQARPDPVSPASAITAYVISYEAQCGAGFSPTFKVVTAFLPDRSWVKPDVLSRPTQSALALRHEQTHFDLSEVHVRRARRAFSQQADPCRGSQTEFDAFMQSFIREDAETQRRYDRETGHGTDEVRQADWDALVRKQLAELREYAR